MTARPANPCQNNSAISCHLTLAVTSEAEHVLEGLGQSPLELTEKQINQIKKTFPIPREQCILWADAEFDLRPSGIAVTGNGVFIKTDVRVFGKLPKLPGKTGPPKTREMN